MSVTLTFDNGPSSTTDGVLDVLRDRGLPATFFVVGSMLERPGARERAERAVAEGHWIGNHSMTHSVPLGSGADAAAEIDGMQAMLGDLTHERRFFRPFGEGGLIGPHLLSPAAVERLCTGGFTCVLWNSVPHDWDDPDGWVDTALAHVAEHEHTVVVLHDLPTGAMDHLPRFLDAVGDDVVQDFPADVLPIVNGRPTGDLTGLVSAS